MGANGKDKGLFLICSDCGWNASVETLERRVLAKLTETSDATPLAVAENWVQAAARAWAHPAQRGPERHL